MSTTPKKGGAFALNDLKAKYRFYIALAAALVALLVILQTGLGWKARVMFVLDVFSLAMLTVSWITIFTMPRQHLRLKAKEEDGSKILVSTLLLIASFGGMLAVSLLLLDKGKNEKIYGFDLVIAVAGMLLSWLLAHTVFVFRYAHLYYADDETGKENDEKGLEFPGGEDPDLLDFAYFSFVLGMTFQVSDVEISRRRIRRLALIHGLIAFFYNTAMIALTINLVAGK